MNYFIIGDVHGCYYTFKNLLNKYWDKENEMVFQLGDLIDRGKNSPQMAQFAIQLSADFPNQVKFLKGNHEFEIISHFDNPPNNNWLRQCGEETLDQYRKMNRDYMNDVRWFRNLPLYWENEHLFLSHAGISEKSENPFIEEDEYGVLWNRSPLKNINKLQIIGHTPCENPHYDIESNTWNIDTGAAYLGYLTGVKIKPNGEILEFIREDTDVRDK
ncbi:metallophosphoesterase family protein [Bacillus sp. 166amftsu]|uniref:metallophosphoesterase family protein n=1 Tax=Bacillus sp. 166amftsu TaxID=1761753 RepID=UPI0008942DC5|nr:metallophosphoesterase family protein [Bacillus sp. 166amftsu]SDZ08221.1 serine/threonine protein phosphatase 1 [Bacillus sp. 166amftsu]